MSCRIVAERWVRSAARTALIASERIAHPLRRNQVIARLRELRLPTRVLFICEGNIYRSPFAAGCFARELPEHLRSECLIGSAGFTGPGRATPADAIVLAAELGVDLSAHRSSLVHAAMLADWDLLVVMNSEQERHLRVRFSVAPSRIVVFGDLDPLPIERRAIPDPWLDPERVLHGCYTRVLRCAETMAAVLAANWDARSGIPVAAVGRDRGTR